MLGTVEQRNALLLRGAATDRFQGSRLAEDEGSNESLADGLRGFDPALNNHWAGGWGRAANGLGPGAFGSLVDGSHPASGLFIDLRGARVGAHGFAKRCGKRKFAFGRRTRSHDGLRNFRGWNLRWPRSGGRLFGNNGRSHLFFE
jgi:hypothetical protein